MKAWQLTLGLAVLAIAAAQLPQDAGDDAAPIRARLDRVVGDADYGFVGPEDRVASVPNVDDTIRRDRRIQQCFAEAMFTAGALPDMIIRFELRPDGTVVDPAITVPATLQGSSLDACLSHAFESLRFAPFVGPSVWFNYPFRNQRAAPLPVERLIAR